MASSPVLVFIGAGAVAALYALRLNLRKQRQIRAIVTRIKERDGAQWQRLPWLHRTMPRVGLNVLFEAAIVGDADTLQLYRGLRRLERRQMTALIVCAAAIVLLLIGAQFWGWRW